MKYRYILLMCALVAVSGMLLCTPVNDVAGGSSSTDNGKVVGTVYDEDGVPSSNTQVVLRSSFFTPNQDTATPPVDTTDTAGEYYFDSLKAGIYTIEAVELTNRTRALVNAVLVDSLTTHASDAALSKPGALEVEVQACSADSCYVYVPGTSLFGIVRNGIAFIDSVPAGVLPAVYYADKSDPSSVRSIRTAINVSSGVTRVVTDYSAWSHSARIYLNTTAEGADVGENVYDFPVLVRLTTEHFDFTGAQSGGGDLRFRKADDTPLSFEIERWDVSAGKADVWVLVDTVYGNDSTHYFIVYWGNDAVTSASNSGAVFDTALGYEGVWHLGGGGAVALDATGNHYDGTLSSGTGVAAVEGAIGGAREFDGSSGYISMEGTSESKLNFPQNGTYTMSLWVCADTIDTLWRAIAGKGHEQYYMQLKCLGENRATWEFVEFQDNLGWEYTEDSVPPAPGMGVWIHIVGVRDGKNQFLYINGEEVVDTASLMEGAYPRDNSNDFAIGRHGSEVVIPFQQGWSYFDGNIDEVRVERQVETPDRIRLGFMNQKADDALVILRR